MAKYWYIFIILQKVSNYEEEWLFLIKIDPVQEFPGNNLSHTFNSWIARMRKSEL